MGRAPARLREWLVSRRRLSAPGGTALPIMALRGSRTSHGQARHRATRRRPTKPWPADRCIEYLAFLGRISPEKGPDAAIEIAVKAGLPLRWRRRLTRSPD